ncbi:hypothetical protein BW723_04840 [Polaribacter reichenbachii]|uniref:Ig-like domain-containing protein n=1 Tax=Polaribacter reichenbachii TaxID=996801 RepID=A0A1B8TUQ3_9FLAO|nr:T9SS type B sorting domain-containing protein [Polaribacter reichenbachii]APZ45664.1 hypothetical protein BW723_04840 [Polaribacter reichenbachii]AUC19526.1 hypothetical protein BTO17_12850 [Polaribacter reichenbachii]OBY63320.1 hypothetical protein LPB301_10870 [Polaribacter reichenbachii]
MTTLNNSLIILFLLVTLNLFCQTTDDKCIVTTINPDFETPINTGTNPIYPDQSDVPGWQTTATDGVIEIWSNTRIPAYSGNQFIELNANEVSGLYQDYDSPEGTLFDYAFAHRGRLGIDTCQLLAGPPGGPYVNVGAPVSTGQVWSYNTGTYLVPAGQPKTRFIFQSVSSTGRETVGNFLDNISFTANVGILTAGPIEVFCGNEVIVESIGNGTWEEDPTNPSITIISDITSNNITISGFATSGEYIYKWVSPFCSSTISIIYDEDLIPAPNVNDISYCEGDIPIPIDIKPIEDYKINWYSDNLGVNNLSEIPTIDTSIVGETIYYVSQQSINGCESTIVPIKIIINTLPVFDLEENYTLCIDESDGKLLNEVVLDTGLDVDKYNFTWFLNGIEIAGATLENYTPIKGGTYRVDVVTKTTSTGAICKTSDTVEIIESSNVIPEIISKVTTEAFADTHIIETQVNGEFEYEYSLDDGPWQEENIFRDVSLGEHIIKVRDTIGCGEASNSVIVIDYPVFFTPNGDGVNDFWKITGMDNQPNSKIYIFDRYGKLLKRLAPTDNGWDGTYNGKLMPENDYWFSIDYIEPNSFTSTNKNFKGHFSLKR